MPATPVSWIPEFTANFTTNGIQSEPDILQLADGNIVVAWTTEDDSGAGSPAGTDLVGRMFDPVGNVVIIGGAETNEFILNFASQGSNEKTISGAALSSGGFIVVYETVSLTSGTTQLRLEELGAIATPGDDSNNVIIDGNANAPNFANPEIAASSPTSVLIAYEKLGVDDPGDIDIAGKIYSTTTNTYSGEITFFDFGVDKVTDAALDVLESVWKIGKRGLSRRFGV